MSTILRTEKYKVKKKNCDGEEPVPRCPIDARALMCNWKETDKAEMTRKETGRNYERALGVNQLKTPARHAEV